MIVRRRGGMTEFIPSPTEKRDGIIHDHTLELLENLHRRLERIERLGRLPPDLAQDFSSMQEHLQDEEIRNIALHAELIHRLP